MRQFTLCWWFWRLVYNHNLILAKKKLARSARVRLVALQLRKVPLVRGGGGTFWKSKQRSTFVQSVKVNTVDNRNAHLLFLSSVLKQATVLTTLAWPLNSRERIHCLHSKWTRTSRDTVFSLIEAAASFSFQKENNQRRLLFKGGFYILKAIVSCVKWSIVSIVTSIGNSNRNATWKIKPEETRNVTHKAIELRKLQLCWESHMQASSIYQCLS